MPRIPKSTRNKLRDITNLSKDTAKKQQPTDELDLLLDLSPIRISNDGIITYTASGICMQHLILNIEIEKPEAFTKPGDKLYIAAPYSKEAARSKSILDSFPTIYSDENYIDPEVVESFVDHCYRLKEQEDAARERRSIAASSTFESSKSIMEENFKEEVLGDFGRKDVSNTTSLDENKRPSPHSMPAKVVRAKKKWFKRIWVRKEQESLPFTEAENLF